MRKYFTCILCPNGCDIEAEIDQGAVVMLEGNICKRGEEYVRQELITPMRNIATSVVVHGGELPLCSVRLTKPIARERIFDVVDAIHQCRLTAPVAPGQIILCDVLGLGSDVIATKMVRKGGDYDEASR